MTLKKVHRNPAISVHGLNGVMKGQMYPFYHLPMTVERTDSGFFYNNTKNLNTILIHFAEITCKRFLVKYYLLDFNTTYEYIDFSTFSL